MPLITAEQARAMGPDAEIETEISAISAEIEAAAKAGRKSVRFPYKLTEIRGEGAVGPKGAIGVAVVDALRIAGYKITDHWEEGQFVDAYLLIEWGKVAND